MYVHCDKSAAEFLQIDTYKCRGDSVADPDPGSVIRCIFDPGIRNQGMWMEKKSRSGSRMNIPDHISGSLETIFFLLKKFFDADPESGICLTLDPGSAMENFGSGINITDPQHWEERGLSSSLRNHVEIFLYIYLEIF